jgi:hypothetical protein
MREEGEHSAYAQNLQSIKQDDIDISEGTEMLYRV